MCVCDPSKRSSGWARETVNTNTHEEWASWKDNNVKKSCLGVKSKLWNKIRLQSKTCKCDVGFDAQKWSRSVRKCNLFAYNKPRNSGLMLLELKRSEQFRKRGLSNNKWDSTLEKGRHTGWGMEGYKKCSFCVSWVYNPENTNCSLLWAGPTNL